MKYLIIIEKTNTGFSAYSPDVDGCITTGKTRAETEQNMREALIFHLEGVLMDDLEMDLPRAQASAHYVEIDEAEVREAARKEAAVSA